MEYIIEQGLLDTPTAEELDAQIEALKEAKIEMVWVTRNIPFGILIPALYLSIYLEVNGVVHAT